MKKLFAAVFALLCATPAFAQVATVGNGTVYAKPDCAHLDFNVLTQNSVAATAHAENKKASDCLFAILKKHNIPEQDASTTQFSIYPFTNEKDNKVSYQVTHSVSVKVDLKQVGAMIDEAVVGNVHLNSIRFAVSNREELEIKARDLAIADAKKKANQMVSGLGEKLGRLTSISENGYAPIIRAAALRSDDQGLTQIASGQLAVSVRVIAVWDVAHSIPFLHDRLPEKASPPPSK